MATITVVHDVDVERRGDGSAPADNEGDFRDNHMDATNPDQSPNTTQFDAGNEDSGKNGTKEIHGIILFDLLSFLPADAVITAAIWHFKVALTNTVSGQTFYVKRCTRTDWVETEVTWNDYKTGSAWTTAGGDMATPEVTLDALTTIGWKSFDIKTLVDDAWDTRSGILTFILWRHVGSDGSGTGEVAIHGKNRHPFDVADPHHLRITYTLDSKTFEAFVFDGIEAAGRTWKRGKPLSQPIPVHQLGI